MKISKKHLWLVGLLQAITIFAYCALVGVVMLNGETFFGTVPNLMAPILVLTILVSSVLVCGILAFGYPVYLFWDKKETKEALELVAFTALWLVLLVIVILAVITIF